MTMKCGSRRSCWFRTDRGGGHLALRFVFLGSLDVVRMNYQCPQAVQRPRVYNEKKKKKKKQRIILPRKRRQREHMGIFAPLHIVSMEQERLSLAPDSIVESISLVS